MILLLVLVTVAGSAMLLMAVVAPALLLQRLVCRTFVDSAAARGDSSVIALLRNDAGCVRAVSRHAWVKPDRGANRAWP